MINAYPEMELIKYTQELEELWNQFVARSKNGTFLLDRRYMDYHRDRFADCSLLFMEKERVFAAFPANVVKDGGEVFSHQGLTYGGLIMSDEINAARVLEAFGLMRQHYRREYGAGRLLYKSVPYIYHRQPGCEDEYALFRNGARLVACNLSSTVNLKAPIAYERSRRNALKKAMRRGWTVEASHDFAAYWDILDAVLKQRHGATPVHSRQELELLAGRFPENIGLYVVRGHEGGIIAGTCVYIYNKVVHTQYMAATDEARHTGALDLLVDDLIHRYAATHRYLDLGTSMQPGTPLLHESLIYQKEGFGGRGICYNQYVVGL